MRAAAVATERAMAIAGGRTEPAPPSPSIVVLGALQRFPAQMQVSLANMPKALKCVHFPAVS